MIENIFLTYANHSLRKYPQKALDIFDEYIRSYPLLDFPFESEMKMTIRYFVAFARCDSLARAEEIFKRKRFKKDSNRRLFEVAFEAVYGYRNGCCQREDWDCDLKRSRPENKGFESQGMYRCFECDQLFFRHILREIARGKNYSQIEPAGQFQQLLFKASKKVAVLWGVVQNSLDSPYQDEILEAHLYKPIFPRKGKSNYKDSFHNAFFIQIILVSLVRFLQDSDRRKLKFCDQCNNFFVSKTRRKSRFCEDQCRHRWHNLRRIESGEAREYKRRKRREGAKPSYY